MTDARFEAGTPPGVPPGGRPGVPPASSPAALAAKPGEDLRWRIAARWAQVLQLVVAVLFLGNAALQVMLSRNDSFWNLSSVFYTVGAGVFVCVFFTLGGWTAANRAGLRAFSGLRHHEVRWSEITQLGRRRMAIQAITHAGRRITLPGLTQARLSELTQIWSHYRGTEEAGRSLAREVRGGLWPVEPPQRFRMPGVALALVVLIGSFVAALVLGVFVGLSTNNLWWAAVVVTVPILAACAPLLRISLAGTTLSPESLKIRLPWRTSIVEWQEVRQVADAGEYVGVVRHDGTRTILYGVPRSQWQVVEGMRAAAMQREA